MSQVNALPLEGVRFSPPGGTFLCTTVTDTMTTVAATLQDVVSEAAVLYYIRSAWKAVQPAPVASALHLQVRRQGGLLGRVLLLYRRSAQTGTEKKLDQFLMP